MHLNIGTCVSLCRVALRYLVGLCCIGSSCRELMDKQGILVSHYYGCAAADDGNGFWHSSLTRMRELDLSLDGGGD